MQSPTVSLTASILPSFQTRELAMNRPTRYAFVGRCHNCTVSNVLVQLTHDLEFHGAVHTPLSSSTLRNVTHLIADSSDFPAYWDAIDGYVHVVRPSWVEQSIQKNRCSNPRQYRPDPNLFFSDVVATFADDIPSGDRDAIVGGLLVMGGQHSPAVTKLVTHVIALTMESPECKVVRSKKLNSKIVLPHWFDVCLKLGKKIDPSPYALPDPLILQDQNQDVCVKDSETGHSSIRGASIHDLGCTPPGSESEPRRKLNVFRRRRIALSHDLDLTPRLHQCIKDIIEQGKGEVVDDVEHADTFICKTRDQASFSTALDCGKEVGNLTWLYYLINANRYSSPTRRLLHFPYPRKGVPGFHDYKITISNYTGEARVYLENLVKAAGGKFTKTLTQDNTHLITAHANSEKVTAAKEWNIHMVNHIWLEQSYAQMQTQSLTNPRYTTFPTHTNLGEVIGQTEIDRDVIAKKHSRDVNKHHQAKAGRLEPLEPNSSNANFQTPATSSKSKLHSSTKDAQSPFGGLSGKENETPSGRGAKDRALNKLHKMAPDIVLYEKESKRAGGVVYGGRRRSTDVDHVSKSSPSHTQKRNTSTQNIPDYASTDVGNPAPNQAKRRRTKSANGPKIRYVVTGGGWEESKAARARKYGLEEVRNVADGAEVLVASRNLRTLNFFLALAHGLPIVDIRWLEACLEGKELLDQEGYGLEDEDGERKFLFKLQDAMALGKKNVERGGLLAGWTLYCTEHVAGGFDQLKKIVVANGGKCLLFKGREASPPPKPEAEDDADEARDEETGRKRFENKLILVSEPKDKKLWPKFGDLCRKGGWEPLVPPQDWLVHAAMRQDLLYWEDEWNDRDLA